MMVVLTSSTLGVEAEEVEPKRAILFGLLFLSLFKYKYWW